MLKPKVRNDSLLFDLLSIKKVFSASKSNRSNDREFSDPKNEVPSKIVSKNAKQVEILVNLFW